jgi:beta-phosphoglucomutase family hydrolase
MPHVRLPANVEACLFDLDGVLTKTAKVHAAAWKTMFDDFLRSRPQPMRPFNLPTDYTAYVDGKLREDGVRSFLESRGVRLPDGDPTDTADRETVHGLATRKNQLVIDLIRRDGVEVYDGSVRFVEAVETAGLHRAVVSASRNCQDVLVAAGIAALFEVRIDGVVAGERGLRGKPAPDMFLAAAEAFGVPAAHAAVFEDAVAGVQAGKAGSFGCVVGVDRGGNDEALRAAGAHMVVRDLCELLEPTA